MIFIETMLSLTVLATNKTSFPTQNIPFEILKSSKFTFSNQSFFFTYHYRWFIIFIHGTRIYPYAINNILFAFLLFQFGFVLFIQIKLFSKQMTANRSVLYDKAMCKIEQLRHFNESRK